MPVYRQKPVLVEAEEYRRGSPPPAGVVVQQHKGEEYAYLGLLLVRDGDFVITQRDGARYALSPQTFWELFEGA